MAQSQFVTQQHRLASMAAWLSSTGISHHDLHPHIPSIHLSAVNSSPRTGIAPQSLNSSSQLSFQETRVSAQGVYGCSKDHLIFFPFRLPQSAVSLSALNVSPLTQTVAPTWGSEPCFSSYLLRAGPVLLTLLFPP